MENGKIKIAILGANSHIAKGLIVNFLISPIYYLHLYVRSADKIEDFLGSICEYKNRVFIHCGYHDLISVGDKYDVIINCIGVGTRNKLNGDFSKYFSVIEEFDNLCIHYLEKINRDSLYISFSSGAVYGRGLNKPANKDTINGILVNNIEPDDYYSIARLNAEAKHRSYKGLNIVDIRVFSYFSQFIDLEDGYFITEIIKSVLNGNVFITGNSNFSRDYLHPKDLFSMVEGIMGSVAINDAYDVCSREPIEKNKIIDFFVTNYNLKYRVDDFFKSASATGEKSYYFSEYNKAKEIGYEPKFSSIDAIRDGVAFILKFK